MALAAHLAQVARTNLAVRSMRVLFYTDIFRVPSKFGESYVYLLTVEHGHQRSREDASNMMDLVKPKLLFLELDKTREHYLQADHYSEQAVAFKYAWDIDTVLGDISDERCEWFQERKREELYKRYGTDPKHKELLDYMAERATTIDLRNVVMTHRLWKHAQNYPSILALVGRNHLYGMRHLWHVMKVSYPTIAAQAEEYEKHLTGETMILRSRK